MPAEQFTVEGLRSVALRGDEVVPAEDVDVREELPATASARLPERDDAPGRIPHGGDSTSAGEVVGIAEKGAAELLRAERARVSVLDGEVRRPVRGRSRRSRLARLSVENRHNAAVMAQDRVGAELSRR